jgi:predicted enzyme related to lactoylglutathione lyase
MHRVTGIGGIFFKAKDAPALHAWYKRHLGIDGVADVQALVKLLREEGCKVLDKVDESEYGKFAWVIDPDGNKVELWEPPPGQ